MIIFRFSLEPNLKLPQRKWVVKIVLTTLAGMPHKFNFPSTKICLKKKHMMPLVNSEIFPLQIYLVNTLTSWGTASSTPRCSLAWLGASFSS